MNTKISDFLKSQRVGVLSVQMPDGSPHGATVHFAYTPEPFVFYFETHKDSLKGKAISEKKVCKASYVVGTSEDEMKTLQMDGEIQQVESSEQAEFDQVYLGKFDEKETKLKNPDIISLKFTPSWWRYSDMTDPEGKVILTSND